MFPRVLNMPLTNGFISGPYTNIWVGKTEAPDVSSWRHIRVVHVAPLNSLEHVPNQTTHCKTTWLAELKPLVFLFLFSVGTWNILKVSDYRNCYEWLLQFEPSTINIYIDSKSFGRQQPCLKCNFSGILEFLDTGRKSWTLDSGPWNLDPGLWTLDSGLWTLHSGLRTLDSRCWTLDCGR